MSGCTDLAATLRYDWRKAMTQLASEKQVTPFVWRT